MEELEKQKDKILKEDLLKTRVLGTKVVSSRRTDSDYLSSSALECLRAQLGHEGPTADRVGLVIFQPHPLLCEAFAGFGLSRAWSFRLDGARECRF
ncbi:hypothetical protein J3F83DRAFT_729152 [Trichoderma novae-zelandiae]